MSHSKQCKQCREIKPLEELVKNKAMKDGRLNKCKLCYAINQKKKYHENHELKLQKAREYRDKNKDKLKKSNRAYKARNREKINAWEREWRKNNPKKSRESSQRYRDSHPNRRKEYYAKNRSILIKKASEWKKENKERYLKTKKEWRIKNYDACLQNERKRNKTIVENLTDGYVVRLLKGQDKGKLLMKDVPTELIEAKRMQILIQREIKNLNKGEEL
jgi:hypothetical protein